MFSYELDHDASAFECIGYILDTRIRQDLSIQFERGTFALLRFCLQLLGVSRIDGIALYFRRRCSSHPETPSQPQTRDTLLFDR
jgi:hypothetical protein